jgi:hypothetical protein
MCKDKRLTKEIFKKIFEILLVDVKRQFIHLNGSMVQNMPNCRIYRPYKFQSNKGMRLSRTSRFTNPFVSLWRLKTR